MALGELAATTATANCGEARWFAPGQSARYDYDGARTFLGNVLRGGMRSDDLSQSVVIASRAPPSIGVAAEDATAFPRFVASKQGIIDTESPALQPPKSNARICRVDGCSVVRFGVVPQFTLVARGVVCLVGVC